MTPTMWSRWLGMSVAVHLAVFGGLWFSARTTGTPTLPALPPGVMVALVDTPDDPTAPALHSIAPSRTRPADSPADSANEPELPAPTTIQPIELTESVSTDNPWDSSADETTPVEPTSAPLPLEPVTSPDSVAGDSPGAAALAPGVPPDAGSSQASDQEDYRPLVLAILDRAKRYPRIGQRLGLEGTVEIAFFIGPDGKISNPQVTVPSPHRVLNEATLAMVLRIGSLPSPPARVPIRFPVRIEYTLSSLASHISTEGVYQ